MKTKMYSVDFGSGFKQCVVAKDIKEAVDKALKSFKFINGSKAYLDVVEGVELIGEED